MSIYRMLILKTEDPNDPPNVGKLCDIIEMESDTPLDAAAMIARLNEESERATKLEEHAAGCRKCADALFDGLGEKPFCPIGEELNR